MLARGPEIERLETAASGAARRLEEYQVAWRELRRRREEVKAAVLRGSAILRDRGLGVRVEDPDILLKDLRRGPDAALQKARRVTASAHRALEIHRNSGGWFGRLMPGWRRTRMTLAGTAARASSQVAILKSRHPQQIETLRVLAGRRALANREANVRERAPLKPFIVRLADLNRMLAAVEAGDASCVACLTRGDHDQLATVARLWWRMDRRGERLSDAEYATYHDARGAPRAAFDPMDFLKPHQGFGGWNRGTVLDAGWRDAAPSASRVTPRRLELADDGRVQGS